MHKCAKKGSLTRFFHEILLFIGSWASKFRFRLENQVFPNWVSLTRFNLKSIVPRDLKFGDS